MEVPTVVSPSFLWHSVEQTVHIPVHGGVKRARGGLPGSVPGKSSAAFSGAAGKVGCVHGCIAEDRGEFP